MFYTLAAMTLVMWVFIPVFLVLLHLGIAYWRRIGIITYPVLLLAGAPFAYLIYISLGWLLGAGFDVPLPLMAAGIFLVCAGILLHLWTLRLLGIKATIGYTEICGNPKDARGLITSGPFSVVRHPSYLAHTMIFTGIFLMTGYYSLGVLVVIDFIISFFAITRLEDRELAARFGSEYEEYMKRIPSYIPRLIK